MTIERTTVKQADLTVLICTLDRPDSLRETLQLLAQNDIDRLDVLVIDNANEPTARAVPNRCQRNFQCDTCTSQRPEKAMR